MEKMIEVKNLAVSYHTYAGEVKSVRGVSFDVYPNETLAIVGESGCGKSVTAKAIMGLIAQPPGEIKEGSAILFEGKDIFKQSYKEWKEYRGSKCSIIFQDALSALNPTMNIGNQIKENIRNHDRRIANKELNQKAVEMLGLVGIPDPGLSLKKYPHQLSGGMRQRVMIAIALSGNPQALIADEPTTALDVTIQAQIIKLMKNLQRQRGMSIILITHDLGVVANFAQRLVVMYSGKIMETGTAEQIFYGHKHPYTWSLLKAAPNLELGKNQTLLSIEGTPPDLIDPPKGCPFAARCKYCMNICLEEVPEEYSFEDGHKCLCHLYHPDSLFQNIDFNKEVQ